MFARACCAVCTILMPMNSNAAFCDWRMNSNEPCVRMHALIRICLFVRSLARFCLCSFLFVAIIIIHWNNLIARIDSRLSECLHSYCCRRLLWFLCAHIHKPNEMKLKPIICTRRSWYNGSKKGDSNFI